MLKQLSCGATCQIPMSFKVLVYNKYFHKIRNGILIPMINRQSFSNPRPWRISHIARFMGPKWGPPGDNRAQVGSMLAPWTLLLGFIHAYQQCATKSPVIQWIFLYRVTIEFCGPSRWVVFHQRENKHNFVKTLLGPISHYYMILDNFSMTTATGNRLHYEFISSSS